MQSDLPSEDSPITRPPTGRGTTGGRWEPPSPEQLQTLLPQYQVSGFLGRGGMGAVYRGTQINLDRPVAIKILPPGLDDTDEGANYAERFKNEARAMAKLSHPGIVAVYDSGETADGLLYIVMEFVEGTDVQKMVSTQGRLHSDHAMAITAHVCDALHYAHERGIVHRDIKPANIMVGYDGVVKVADFGLAKMSRAGESGLTRTGTAMGTLHYMAPEALTLGTSVDHRADVYAVGVMLYFMLTGRLPQGMFELPSMQISGLDPRFDKVITQALRDDRDVRFQSARAMRGELDAMLTQPVAQVKVRTSPPPETPPRQTRTGGRPAFEHAPEELPRRGSSPLLWCALVAMGALVLWMWLGRQPQQPEQAGSAPAVETSADAPAATTGPKPAANTTTAPGVRIEANVPVSTDLKPGVWHNLLDARFFGLAGLQKTEDSSAEQPHYLSRGAQHKAAPQVLRNCALRLRFSGEWQAEPMLFLRRPRETNVLESMSAKLEGYSARLSRHYLPNLIKPLVVVPLTAATARNKSVELEFRVVGEKYTLLRDGVVVAEAVDPTYATGRVGVFLPQGIVVEKAEVMLLPATEDQPYADGDWQPLLEGRPEIVQRLQIKDGATGWKVMQKGFAPLLNEKNVAVRLRALGNDLRVVARWSESGTNGVYGHTFRIGNDTTKQLRLFGGSVNTVATEDGVVQPKSYLTWGNVAFPVVAGQEYELELRSFEDRVEVLVDGKPALFIREESLPGTTTALHPLRTVTFKDLVWRRLAPPAGGPAAPSSGQSWTDSQGRRINATFVRLAGEQAVLNTQGREYTVPLTALSPESRELATRLGAPNADKPVPPAVAAAPALASGTPPSAPMPTVPAPSTPATAPVPSGPPSWTDRKGRQIQAAFVRLEKDAVVVAMSGSGKETPLPFSTLSEESVRQAQELGSTRTNTTGPVPQAGAFDEADSLTHRFTFNAAGETGADIQRASLKDGMLFLDGRYEYETLTVAGTRAMLQCRDFTPEDFTLAVKLSRDRSKTILITGGYHDRSVSGRGTPRWLSVSCESGGKLLVEIPSLNHKDVIEKADVPVGKPFTLVLAGNLKLGPVQVYLDGRRLATIPLIRDANAAPAPDLDDYLSFTHPGNRESLKGKVDELRMYGRTLQDSEVASLQLGGDQVLALSSPGKITTRSLPPRRALTTGLRNVEFPATAGGKDIGRYLDDLLGYDTGKDTAQIKIIEAELTNLLQDVAQEHFDQLLMALPRVKRTLSTGKCEAVQQVALAHADPQNRTMIIQAMQYFPPMLEVIRAKGWAMDALPSVITTLDTFGNPKSVADTNTAFLADCARMDAPAVWGALDRLYGKAEFDNRAPYFAYFVYRLSLEEKRQFLPQLGSLARTAWKALPKPGPGTKTSVALDQITWARAAAQVGVMEAVETLSRFAATGTPDVGSYFQEAQLKVVASTLQQVTGHTGDATPAVVGKWVLERLPSLKWNAAQMRYQ